jgi:hypothetical protein
VGGLGCPRAACKSRCGLVHVEPQGLRHTDRFSAESSASGGIEPTCPKRLSAGSSRPLRNASSRCTENRGTYSSRDTRKNSFPPAF